MKKEYELKKQHVVDCTWALMAFDKKEDAERFAETAVAEDYHDPNDSSGIVQRESYVLWKGDDLEIELVGWGEKASRQFLSEILENESQEEDPNSLFELKKRHTVTFEASKGTPGSQFTFDAQEEAEAFRKEHLHHNATQGVAFDIFVKGKKVKRLENESETEAFQIFSEFVKEYNKIEEVEQFYR